MARWLALAYGIAAYLGFLAVFVLLGGFLVDVGPLAGIDDRPSSVPAAVAVDIALLALFGVSHSTMARPWFKRWWTRVIPPVIERSTYVLVTVLVFVLLAWQWRSIPTTVWQVDDPIARAVIFGVAGLGVALLVVSTFLTDHFDLFGLRQVWLHARGQPYTPVPFQERGLYRHVRHPMMVGILLWFWAAPTMSAGHLLFTAGMTAYVFIGVALEERGLSRALGDDYRAYRARVPAFLPFRRG